MIKYKHAKKWIEKLSSHPEWARCEIDGLALDELEQIMKFLPVIESLEKQFAFYQWHPFPDEIPIIINFANEFIIQKEGVELPFTAYWDGNQWSDNNCEIVKNVIAWMNLPHPYKIKKGD